MPKAEHKNFSTPDERKAFPHGKVELLNIGGGTIRRLTLEPGWCWSKDNKPATGTEWCEVLHFQYQLSGRMHILMKDGSEFDLGPGDVAALPSGHDGWVIGSEPVVLVDWLRQQLCGHLTFSRNAMHNYGEIEYALIASRVVNAAVNK